MSVTFTSGLRVWEPDRGTECPHCPQSHWAAHSRWVTSAGNWVLRDRTLPADALRGFRLERGQEGCPHPLLGLLGGQKGPKADLLTSWP